MLDFVFIGPPASGKGTQAKILSETLGLHPLSTGELLRASIAAGNPGGLAVKAFVERGDLVPDAEIVAILSDAVADTKGNGIIFDGFPRTVPQAKALDELLLSIKRKVNYAFLFDVDFESLVARMEARTQQAMNDGKGKRADDTKSTLSKRLNEYRLLTSELVPFYEERGVLRRINGFRPVEDVSREIVSAIA